MDLITIGAKLYNAGPAFIFCLALLTGWKKMWVFSDQLVSCNAAWQKHHDEVVALMKERFDAERADKEGWRQIAMHGTSATAELLRKVA